ncbi:12421_t:CDS:1, partial [Funneliformis geosporum]
TNYFEITNKSSRKYGYPTRYFKFNSPLLAQIPQYVGQELPDDYYNKIIQAINYIRSSSL